MSAPHPRRRYWILAVAVLALAALGAGMAVRADLETRPPVVPYDPLTRW
jgi:hypothetical protein